MVEIFDQPPGDGALRLIARYILRDWARIGPRPYQTLQVGLTSDVAPLSATGKMPVPQKINFLVEQASCLFLTMVQDVSLTGFDIRGDRPPVSPKINF